MNLIDLEAFVSVVSRGSIVAAAAHLHLTQSAVTRRIQNLEDVLAHRCLTARLGPCSRLALVARPTSSQSRC
jgi:DNA-binding transcriptional LysR family regulator